MGTNEPIHHREREKGDQRCNDCGVASPRTRQSQHDKQVHDGDVRNARVEMKPVHAHGNQHRTSHCQGAIEQILPPAKCAMSRIWACVDNSTHKNTNFQKRLIAVFLCNLDASSMTVGAVNNGILQLPREVQALSPQKYIPPKVKKKAGYFEKCSKNAQEAEQLDMS